MSGRSTFYSALFALCGRTIGQLATVVRTKSPHLLDPRLGTTPLEKVAGPPRASSIWMEQEMRQRHTCRFREQPRRCAAFSRRHSSSTSCTRPENNRVFYMAFLSMFLPVDDSSDPVTLGPSLR